MTQYLMGLDLGGKKGRCLLLDVESGAAVATCRPWQHRMTAGFGYDLDTVEVWRCFGEAAREAMAKVGARPQDVLAVSTTGMRHGSVSTGRRWRNIAGDADTGCARRDAWPAVGGPTRAGVSRPHWPLSGAVVHGFPLVVDGGLSARAFRSGTRRVGTERLAGISAVGKDGR